MNLRKSLDAVGEQRLFIMMKVIDPLNLHGYARFNSLTPNDSLEGVPHRKADFTMTGVAERPAFVDNLEYIFLSESASGVYTPVWRDATTDDELRAALDRVGAREASHGDVFCRRLNELGYGRGLESVDAMERLRGVDDALIGVYEVWIDPNASDYDKIKAHGLLDPGPALAYFNMLEEKNEAGYFGDEMTTLLMRWYISEERDSVEVLLKAYRAVAEREV